jgi:hypothetical protein
VDFSSQEVMLLINKFKNRVLARAEDERLKEDVSQHVDQLVNEWAERAKSEPNLVYEKNVSSESPLIVRFDEIGRNGLNNPWRTLTSMRSVDVDVRVNVEGRR